MNNKDRIRLERFSKLMLSVPFASDGSGAASATVVGFVGYSNDMRQLMPALKAVLYGMACENYDTLYGWEKGEDYHDPDVTMDRIQQWIEQRNREGWEASRTRLVYR